MDTEELKTEDNKTVDVDAEDTESEDAKTEELMSDDIPIIEFPEAYVISDIKGGKKSQIHVVETLKKVLFTPEFYFAVSLLYFELLFHLVRFGFKADNLSFKLLFAIFYGIVLGTFASVFTKLVSVILTFVFTTFFTVYFIVQIVFSGVFGTYLSLSGSIGVATQALDFTDVIFKELKEEWYIILFMLLPVILLSVFLRKHINFERHKLYMYVVSIGAAVLSFVIILISMQAGKNRVYSTYEVYRDYTSVDMSVEKLGVIESFYLDTKVGIKEKFGIKDEKVSFVAETEEEITTEEVTTEQNKKEDKQEEAVIDTTPNILDIDFDELMATAPNENIRTMHEYISQVKPTNKNEYTGMFEGYNLIFVVAEGFYGLSIDQNRTPMLYKMKYKGFCFDNYYTPLWYGSTLGGEYADLTGLMPRSGGYLAMSKAGYNKNDMMFTLSRELLDKGYTVKGYHNNYYTYYDRNVSHPNLGYDWIGVGNGFEPEYGPGGNMLWPQSDEYMIETTFDEYADDEPFHIYYLTVSGHVMYNFGGNAMSQKHRDLVEDMDYSETTKAYLACQYELELAMEKLVDKLEEKGIADKTLIVLTADHVPYDNKDVCDELAGHTLDSTFEWFENTLIIWSPSMEQPVYVEKCCSSLDVLPTVLNLMGLPYDSRMLAGQDALSDSEGLVMFNDRSFITDRISYNANTGEVISLDGKPVDEDYVEAKVAQVRNKFSMAEKICDYDYYRYIDEYINGR
ncbi:MAG: sulfatase-like hydrolase/transferase [Lachnospiraceae bacterium]|nr:sulfatase-like hydrolase/transferase [Lachnospiraceae bacterium]